VNELFDAYRCPLVRADKLILIRSCRAAARSTTLEASRRRSAGFSRQVFLTVHLTASLHYIRRVIFAKLHRGKYIPISSASTSSPSCAVLETGEVILIQHCPEPAAVGLPRKRIPFE